VINQSLRALSDGQHPASSIFQGLESHVVERPNRGKMARVAGAFTAILVHLRPKERRLASRRAAQG
jgi:hypothetical protein